MISQPTKGHSVTENVMSHITHVRHRMYIYQDSSFIVGLPVLLPQHV